MREVNLKTLEVDGIDTRDYPDFVDSYASYLEYTDGTPLTDDELSEFTDKNSDLVQEAALESCY